jgi:opacity protein-like surface antigen
MKRYLIIAVIAFLSSMSSVYAQKVGVKSNALYWATATSNLGFEFAMGERWTFELEGGYNPWTLNAEKNMKVKHWLVSPEFRYWFCEAFQGHFVGINGNFTQFNTGGLPLPIQKAFITISPKDAPVSDVTASRMEGWAVGAGITYGYAFPIARRWNLEFTAGFGWWYTSCSQYESRKCGLFQYPVSKHLLGPTSLGVSFLYMIK